MLGKYFFYLFDLFSRPTDFWLFLGETLIGQVFSVRFIKCTAIPWIIYGNAIEIEWFENRVASEHTLYDRTELNFDCVDSTFCYFFFLLMPKRIEFNGIIQRRERNSAALNFVEIRIDIANMHWNELNDAIIFSLKFPIQTVDHLLNALVVDLFFISHSSEKKHHF